MLKFHVHFSLCYTVSEKELATSLHLVLFRVTLMNLEVTLGEAIFKEETIEREREGSLVS